MLTEEQKEENRRWAQLAETNAKKTLKPGDRLRVTKCSGTKRWITFSHWDGHWIVSKSGIDDYHPITVDMLNGQPVDFTGRRATADRCAMVDTATAPGIAREDDTA